MLALLRMAIKKEIEKSNQHYTFLWKYNSRFLKTKPSAYILTDKCCKIILFCRMTLFTVNYGIQYISHWLTYKRLL